MKTGIMIAPNGARLISKDHKSLPLDKKSIANCARLCEKAGANAIHLHVRDKNEKHILDVNKYKQTINQIKKRCSDDFIIQTTTEAVGIYKPKEIISLIRELKPQATSISIKELLPNKDDKNELLDAKKLYKFARDENIGVQHILYSKEDLKRFNKLLEQDVIAGDKHSILFVLGRYSKKLKCKTDEILPFLQILQKLKLNNKVKWMICAFGQEEIPALVGASLFGGNCRIGFENSRTTPSGSVAKNNESQVLYLKKQLNALNIKSVTSDEMKMILGIYK